MKKAEIKINQFEHRDTISTSDKKSTALFVLSGTADTMLGNISLTTQTGKIYKGTAFQSAYASYTFVYDEDSQSGQDLYNNDVSGVMSCYDGTYTLNGSTFTLKQ